MIVTPEQLAEIAYTAYVRSFTNPEVAEHTEIWTWDSLSEEGKKNWTAAATAVRNQVDQMWSKAAEDHLRDSDEKTAVRFREAVEIAYQQMHIRTTREMAAWYLIREWLEKERK